MLKAEMEKRTEGGGQTVSNMEMLKFET